MAGADSDEVLPEDPGKEARQVYLWRRQCFLQDHFSWDQAVRLATQGADHHAAEDLLAHGCPRDLVYALLLR